MPAAPEPRPPRFPALSAAAPALFALAMIAAAAIYAWSVIDTSRGPQDWLMIVPATAICIAALLWAATSDTIRELAARQRAAAAERDGALLPVVLLVLICLYAAAIAFIGFDVATALFIAAALIVQGERRILWLAVSALGGTALLVWIFTGPLAVRLPTLLF